MLKFYRRLLPFLENVINLKIQITIVVKSASTVMLFISTSTLLVKWFPIVILQRQEYESYVVLTNLNDVIDMIDNDWRKTIVRLATGTPGKILLTQSIISLNQLFSPSWLWDHSSSSSSSLPLFNIMIFVWGWCPPRDYTSDPFRNHILKSPTSKFAS